MKGQGASRGKTTFVYVISDKSLISSGYGAEIMIRDHRPCVSGTFTFDPSRSSVIQPSQRPGEDGLHSCTGSLPAHPRC